MPPDPRLDAAIPCFVDDGIDETVPPSAAARLRQARIDLWRAADREQRTLMLIVTGAFAPEMERA